jgi:hypothetical protein
MYDVNYSPYNPVSYAGYGYNPAPASYYGAYDPYLWVNTATPIPAEEQEEIFNLIRELVPSAEELDNQAKFNVAINELADTLKEIGEGESLPNDEQHTRLAQLLTPFKNTRGIQSSIRSYLKEFDKFPPTSQLTLPLFSSTSLLPSSPPIESTSSAVFPPSASSSLSQPISTLTEISSGLSTPLPSSVSPSISMPPYESVPLSLSEELFQSPSLPQQTSTLLTETPPSGYALPMASTGTPLQQPFPAPPVQPSPSETSTSPFTSPLPSLEPVPSPPPYPLFSLLSPYTSPASSFSSSSSSFASSGSSSLPSSGTSPFVPPVVSFPSHGLPTPSPTLFVPPSPSSSSTAPPSSSSVSPQVPQQPPYRPLYQVPTRVGPMAPDLQKRMAQSYIEKLSNDIEASGDNRSLQLQLAANAISPTYLRMFGSLPEYTQFLDNLTSQQLIPARVSQPQ